MRVGLGVARGELVEGDALAEVVAGREAVGRGVGDDFGSCCAVGVVVRVVNAAGVPEGFAPGIDADGIGWAAGLLASPD